MSHRADDLDVCARRVEGEVAHILRALSTIRRPPAGSEEPSVNEAQADDDLQGDFRISHIGQGDAAFAPVKGLSCSGPEGRRHVSSGAGFQPRFAVPLPGEREEEPDGRGEGEEQQKKNALRGILGEAQTTASDGNHVPKDESHMHAEPDPCGRLEQEQEHDGIPSHEARNEHERMDGERHAHQRVGLDQVIEAVTLPILWRLASQRDHHVHDAQEEGCGEKAPIHSRECARCRAHDMGELASA